MMSEVMEDAYLHRSKKRGEDKERKRIMRFVYKATSTYYFGERSK